MGIWRCTVCNYMYDENSRQKFNELPGNYTCPVCGAPKSAFALYSGAGKALRPSDIRTVSDKIVEQLSAFGVRHIYGIPGDSNLPLFESLRKQDKIKFILTRHEETAAFMASAHAKLTDRLGVCISIAGPGATNLITGLMDAATDRAPVLALTGQVPEVYLGSEGFQEIDQLSIFEPFTVFNEAIVRSSQAVKLTTLAIKKAYAERALSHLCTPTDVLGEELYEAIKPAKIDSPISGACSDANIKKALKIIDKSERPFIFAGWGARHCEKELLELSRKISAPIATTSRAKGVVSEKLPLALGVLGAIGTPTAARAAAKSDLIIIAGSGFRQSSLVPNAPIIQIDVDPSKIGRNFSVELGLAGDAKSVLKAFAARAREKKADEKYINEIAEIKKGYFEKIGEHARNYSRPIYPGFVVQAIKRNVENNSIICVDVGDHTYWFYRYFVCEGQRTLMSANMASMGFALPAALSAQIDYPDKQVLCVASDGGFGMLMADFTTAVYNSLPIKVVLFNDGRLKNIKKEQAMYGFREYGISFANPDFAGFANSCGGLGIKVEDPKELDSALKTAFESGKPAIVDVAVDPEALTPIVKYATQ